ncbi:MAG: hypothetical protein ACR2OU_20580 [Thermomicrobiales bacterium]
MKTDVAAEESVSLSTSSIPTQYTESIGATETTTLTPSARGRTESLRRWIDRATPLQLGVGQWLSAAIMVFALLCTPVMGSKKGLPDIIGNYGALERVALWQRSLSWLPGAKADVGFMTLPPGVIVYSLRFGMIMMFVFQAWSFWQAWNGRHKSVWKWLIGPIGAHIVMLLMVPSNADVFFYAMSGDLANKGFNPYVYPLYDFPSHPLYAYNYWVDMTTVYGPFWTDINRVIMWITGPDPFWSTMAYKVFLGLAALALAGLVYVFAKRLTGNIALACAAMVLVAWQPNMILETSGQAHNDPIMLMLMTAGVMLVIVGGTRAIRGALVLVTASAGIKYVTLPVLALIGLIRLGDRRGPRWIQRLLANWIVDGIAILAVLVVAFLPYWTGFGVVSEMVSEPGRNFSHPFWRFPGKLLDVAFSWSVAHWYFDIMRIALQLGTVFFIGVALWKFGKILWSGIAPSVIDDEESRDLPAWTDGLLVSWTIILATLALLPANSHSWYYMWPVVPIAILIVWRGRLQGSDSRSLPGWFWGYVALTCVMTLIYHTTVYNF